MPSTASKPGRTDHLPSVASSLNDRATAAWSWLSDVTSRIHPSVLFLAGVLWDWATLRIDRVADNVLLAAYLLALIAIFVIQLRSAADRWVPPLFERHPVRLRMAEQFLLGALLSAFWVHIVRALHPGPTAVFAAGLIAVAIANELNFGPLRAGLARAAMVTFCTFQLLSVVLPLITRELVWIGWPLLGAMLASAAMLVLAQVDRNRPKPLDWVTDVGAPISASALAAFGLFAAIQAGLVPALPLVLRDGHVAREVRWEQGELQVDRYAEPLVSRLGLRRQVVTPDPKNGLSAYTAIYAPAGMELELAHRWEWYDPETETWSTTDRIPLEVKGAGEQRGWRTWSTKHNLRNGDWRVRVVTPYGQELGRILFEVQGASPAGS